jgi:hypothetical protein
MSWNFNDNKKISHELLVYETLFNTFIGDALGAYEK